MIKFNFYNLVIFIFFLNLIYSCSSVRESAGVVRKSPDEFQAVLNPPLIIPPDFNLVPPDQLQQKNLDNIERDLAEEILFGLNENKDLSGVQLSTMNQILLKTNATNVSAAIRSEINEDFANEMKTGEALQLNWENEIEVLDAVKESERIREKKYNNESIADGDIFIKKEKVKMKKKKRFFFF